MKCFKIFVKAIDRYVQIVFSHFFFLFVFKYTMTNLNIYQYIALIEADRDIDRLLSFMLTSCLY